MIDPLVYTVLRLRLAYAQASVKKFFSIDLTSFLGRVYNTLQAWGAQRTGRWAGRGLQLQNLKRPTMKDPDFAADLLANKPAMFKLWMELEDAGSLIRSAIKAGPGKAIVCSDESSIESRVLGWITGCNWINGLFREGKDTYKAFAEIWLGITYDQVDKPTRNLAKPPFLGFGYGIGAAGLKTYADGMGVDLTDEQCESAIAVARKVCWEVPKFWRKIEACFLHTIRTGEASGDEMGFPVRIEGRFLTVTLPNGRKLYYDEPQVDVDGIISYMGMNQYTRQWSRLDTWGGKITENICQAIARDVLVTGMLRYRAGGGTIIGHVHDEVIAEENAEQADQWLAFMDHCLTAPMDWAKGLLLGSEGYVATRYRKG